MTSSGPKLTGITPDSPFRADIFKGQAALVVGGGSGICFDIALTLGLHGASVGTFINSFLPCFSLEHRLARLFAL